MAYRSYESGETWSVKVLIADDSALVRKNVRMLLSTVETVSDLREADSVRSTIEAIETDRPDAVILDLHMTDGSGFEVLSYLKSSSNRPTVIVLTTFAGSSERERAISLGADYFLDKSTEYERLFELL